MVHAEGKEIAQVTVPDVNKKSITEIAEFLDQEKRKIEKGENQGLEKIQKLASTLPAIVLKPLIGLAAFAMYNLELDIPFLGLKADGFGQAVVSDLSSLGFQEVTFSLTRFMPRWRILLAPRWLLP